MGEIYHKKPKMSSYRLNGRGYNNLYEGKTSGNEEVARDWEDKAGSEGVVVSGEFEPIGQAAQTGDCRQSEDELVWGDGARKMDARVGNSWGSNRVWIYVWGGSKGTQNVSG